MHESYVGKTHIAAVTLWSVVVALTVAAWLLVLLAPHRWLFAAMMIGTACVLAAGGVALHARLCTIRVCGLLRAVSGLVEPEKPESQLRVVPESASDRR